MNERHDLINFFCWILTIPVKSFTIRQAKLSLVPVSITTNTIICCLTTCTWQLLAYKEPIYKYWMFYILFTLEHWEAILTSMSLKFKLGHHQRLTPNSLNQRWTNSPFLRFTIHCNSHVDFDDSIQLDSSFLSSRF